MRRGDVLLFTDWTLLRLFPPLRSAWARVGEQAEVPITGRNAKRVLFGSINPRTGHRVVMCRPAAKGEDARAFFLELRQRYRRARTIWLLLDRAGSHTAGWTLRLAELCDIKLVWLPKQAPELNAMDQLWRDLKQVVAANRQAESIDTLAEQAELWIVGLTKTEALRKASILSKDFWLKDLLQYFWPPT
jgi:transposase